MNKHKRTLEQKIKDLENRVGIGRGGKSEIVYYRICKRLLKQAVKERNTDALINLQKKILHGIISRYNQIIPSDVEDILEYVFNTIDINLELEPENCEVLLLKSYSLLIQEAFESAIDYADKALKIKSDYAEALVLKGEAFYHLEKFEEARKSYDKAFEIKPSLESALFYNKEIYDWY